MVNEGMVVLYCDDSAYQKIKNIEGLKFIRRHKGFDFFFCKLDSNITGGDSDA